MSATRRHASLGLATLLSATALGLASTALAGARDLRFETAPAMLAANEEWLTFSCELPDGQVPIGSAKSVEMYYYSRYGLGNLLMRSGMGVHLVHNPLFAEHVATDEGMPWYGQPDGSRQFLMHKAAQFVSATGGQHASIPLPLPGAFPIYLEFNSGVPAFQQAPDLSDLSTLRWDADQMDQTMSPAGWGQAMMKEVLWARDFFTGTHTVDGVTYLGNGKDDGANGFRGAMLTGLAITKSAALKNVLAYSPATGELGAVDPMTYDPMHGLQYYPHEYTVDLMQPPMVGAPPMPTAFHVTDDRSVLMDVSSLLWAESEFYFYSDPTIEDDYNAVFGDPRWMPADNDGARAIFPSKVHMLAKGLTAVNFKNLKMLHFNDTHGAFVDVWSPSEGQGTHVDVVQVGLTVTALANTFQHMHDVPMMRDGAQMMLRAQAEFLLAHQNDDGSIANGFTLKSKAGKVKADRDAPTLAAQSQAIRAWIEAYHVTDDQRYVDAAERTYDYMEATLWSEAAGVYRSSAGADESEFDGINFATTLGALRELGIVREGDARRQIVGRLDSFFEQVAQRGGLQIAEIGMTGEPIPGMAERQQMMGQMQAMMATDPEGAQAMRMHMADSDGDGVPKPIFVMGTEFGAAPVQAARITLETR